MSSGPENRFINSIHDKMKGLGNPYFEKMHNPYRGGTPDVWYSGDAADLWVEYKYIKAAPKRTAMVKPDLSDLQIKWLRGRQREGRNVMVVLGVGPDIRTASAIWFTSPREWEEGVSLQEFTARLVSKTVLPGWIRHWTMREANGTTGGAPYGRDSRGAHLQDNNNRVLDLRANQVPIQQAKAGPSS